MFDKVEKEIVIADKMPECLRAGKTTQDDRKTEREHVSMKEKLSEKKAEAKKGSNLRSNIPCNDIGSKSLIYLDEITMDIYKEKIQKIHVNVIR